MSKTTEALKLAEEAVEDIVKNATNYDRSIYVTKAVAEKALAAIREALAEQSPDATKMVRCAYCNNPLFAGTKCNNCGRVTLAEPVKQEPVALPEWPELETLADIEYAQVQKPENWDDGHFKVWQDLQVAQRNKIILHKYAKQLRELLSTTSVVQQGEPVAWALMHKNGLEFNTGYGMVKTLQQAEDMQRRHLGALKVVPLYTTPPQREWVEPSDEQIYDVCKDVPFVVIGPDYDKEIARAVLKLSKELNNR